jgi:hypothetical protein
MPIAAGESSSNCQSERPLLDALQVAVGKLRVEDCSARSQRAGAARFQHSKSHTPNSSAAVSSSRKNSVDMRVPAIAAVRHFDRTHPANDSAWSRIF